MQTKITTKFSKIFDVFFIVNVLFFASLISVPTLGQNANFDLLYQKAVSIDSNTVLTYSQKTNLLLNLKQQAEEKQQTSDFGYGIVLVKLAKNSYIQNSIVSPLIIEYSEKALLVLQNAKPKPPVTTYINALFNLARYYQIHLQYNQALACYDSVIKECKEKPIDDYEISSRFNKTQIYFDIGDFQKASEESSLGINQFSKRFDSTKLTGFYNFRAFSYLFQGLTEQALNDANKASDIAQKTNDLFYTAQSYEFKGLFYEKQKSFQQAENFLKLTIATRQLSDVRLEAFALDYMNLGDFYFRIVTSKRLVIL